MILILSAIILYAAAIVFTLTLCGAAGAAERQREETAVQEIKNLSERRDGLRV